MPGGGLEPPRREALTPEASVSTNSTTAAQSVVDGVHVMRQVANRQLSDANFQRFLPPLPKLSTKCCLLRRLKAEKPFNKKAKGELRFAFSLNRYREYQYLAFLIKPISSKRCIR